ncbi:MarR family winged helix-turn-helix transcriptional regulator [Thermoflavimicrobium daqui]|uniref:MarR family transcriptional regulator n=1 Tax=Thermoflavimicrobium daqui TaxID=2137476 RepID=A0A364K4F1_9BACL|nr:MarR family winged helix-turn-helix transcriptional regulator [Thermoflavimicrobium daqui]RAL24171.1 hypothetical protein DL897_10835 [Thermoflavimicrobium daqui]
MDINQESYKKVKRRKHFSHYSEKPFGWYLKRLDKLITSHVNELFKDKELTRFHWQALNNTYHEGTKTKESLHELVQDYVDKKKLDEVIHSLVERGWMIRNESSGQQITKLELTSKGKKEFPSLDAILYEFDQRVFYGVTKEEYQIVIKVLTRMINNLDKGSKLSTP